MTDTASQYDKPGIPANTRAGLAAMNHDKPLAKIDDVDDILDQLRTGKSVIELAASIGISHQALYEWLIKRCPEDWQAIQAARQLARLDDCEQVFDNEGADGLAISRTREKTKLAQWHLERANRKLFGDSKSEGAGKVQIVIQRLDSTDNVGVTICGDDRPSLPGE